MSGIATTLPIAPGALLHNKYEPMQMIGGGNFGEVWLAKDHAVDHTYAIKILKPGVTVVNQLREAQIGHAFTHNNLVRVHQADVLTDGRVIIAMDFLPDGPITTLANPANFLPLPLAIKTTVDTLQGLEHLHASSFFHNDIKPENILRGQDGQARLGDYGIVGISQNGQPVPAPARYILHAAPETTAGNGIEARTDILQTGLTLFRLLAGLGALRAKFNFLGQANYEAALAAGTLLAASDFPPYIPNAVIRVIKKAIDPDPGKRFQSALEMRRALEKPAFPGHWTVDPGGAFIGLDKRHQFRFESLAAAGTNASLEAFKRNLQSNRETRVSAFTKSNMPAAEVRKLEIAFIRAVVAGKSRMNTSPQFTTSEAGGAQLQALNTLINCGWRYVTRAEADQWRDGRRALPFLETQLRADLARINRIYLDERAYPFSEANIDAAVRRLADRIPEGVVRANERMTDDLMLGIALPQTIGATSREWPFRFIDWSDWRANTFQVTSEYTVTEAGGPTIRVDLVLFVNGIPLGVIEVKASHVSSDQGVSQQIRNQKTGEGVPALFYSGQLLLAANSHDPRYGTIGTPRKLWSAWKEREDPADFAVDIVNRPLDSVESKRVAIDFVPYMKRHNGLMEEHRFVTALDETIVGLCRPERFMRLVRRYMLFDGPQKKVARYQQIATIESLLKRTEERDETGKRRGGVVWHTQGSGKSLTMVMLAKAIAMKDPLARILIVTDRTDLDDQISKTFRATGQEPKRAATGENLLALIEEKTPVVTTLIHKFRAGLNKRRVVDRSSDIFVLVDESHRSQYGNLDSLHARMREVLPNACFIAFTGTPIAKKEKSTFAKFGDLVQPSYSMRDAVSDKAVVPLLYEGREVVTDVDEGQIDRWFEVHTRGLSDKQRADLKRKMSRAREIEGIESRLQSIAFDVGQHFSNNFKGTGLKGQLAAPSKRAAIQLKKLFDSFGMVTAEVIISAPEMRESEDEVDESDDDVVRAFWRKMMARYGGEDAYNKTIVEQFKGPGEPDIIIVVDKLLTGFDAPRNTVLYIARRLKEHGLLQAIARVNRVFDEEGAPDKPFGFIIDYTGVLKNLGAALASYDALQGFSEEDIARSVVAIRDEANKVPGAHAALLDVFKSVSNTFDAEAYARLLADEEVRAEFYRRLAEFTRTFTVALASPSFLESTKPELLKRWKDDLGRFTSLRASVSLRYAERVDWRDFEKRIRQLLDRHVVARDVVRLVEPLNIFDDIAIEARREEKSESEASIADTIAHQLTRSIEEKWDEDPIFFEKFSKLIRDTIADFHNGRISEMAYLSKVRDLREKVQQRRDDTDPTPTRLRDDSHAQAFWGLARRNLEKAGIADTELAADIALKVSGIVQSRCKVGWQHDRDIENLIRNDIDDFFFEDLLGRRELLIDPSVLDAVVDDVLASARVRLAQ